MLCFDFHLCKDTEITRRYILQTYTPKWPSQLKATDLLNSLNQGDSDEEGSETDEDDNLDDTEEVAEKDDSEAETEDEDDNKEKEVDKKELVSSLIHRKKLCYFLLIKK